MAEKKNYLDLREKVWDAGICSGCGACIAVCPADALFFVSEQGIEHPSSSGYCKSDTDSVPCGACYDACPRVNPQNHNLIGSFRQILRAQATKEHEYRQNGGAVTAILISAMQAGYLDGVVTVTEDRWTHEPRSILITHAGNLAEHAGSRYNWSVPVLRSLKTAVVDKKLTRIAIVGTPCVVQAARAIQSSSNDLLIPFGRSIRLIIGLFCTESFDYHQFMDEILNRNRGILPNQVSRMDIKGRLELSLTDGSVETIPLEEAARAVRKGCLSCDDFSAPDADISAGSIGTPTGFTTLIIRTETGEGFMKRAVQAGFLSTDEGVDTAGIEKLAASKKTRVDHQ